MRGAITFAMFLVNKVTILPILQEGFDQTKAGAIGAVRASDWRMTDHGCL
jgi:hypothetical protein